MKKYAMLQKKGYFAKIPNSLASVEILSSNFLQVRLIIIIK